MNPFDDIDGTIEEIVDEFDLLGDDNSKFEHVIELGKALNSLPADECVPANEIPNCAYKGWLVAERSDGRMFFRASSDSIISRGNIALVLRVVNGRTPSEILHVNMKAFLDRLGLPQALSRQRANGLNGIVGKIRAHAIEADQNALGSPAS